MNELALVLIAFAIGALAFLAFVNARLWKIRSDMDTHLIAWMREQENMNRAFIDSIRVLTEGK